MKIRFVIYGAIGWILEIIWTGIGSLLKGDLSLKGFSSLWMFLIYGLGLFLEPIHDRIRGLHWFRRGLIWTMLIFAIEYGSGWFIWAVTGHYAWFYNGTPFAVNGLIRLDYAPAWFGLGLLFEKLHDSLNRGINIS